MRQVADKAHDPQVEVAHAVQVGVAAAGYAVGAAQQVAEDARGRHPAQQVTAQVTVHGRHHVVGCQRIAGADADCLVPALAEGAAHPTALLPQRHHALVKAARQLHPVEEFKLLLRASTPLLLHFLADCRRNRCHHCLRRHTGRVDEDGIVRCAQGRDRPVRVDLITA